MGEQLLVVRTQELKKHLDFQGFIPLSPEKIHELYDTLEILPMDRDLAETDPTFKQLVAYSLIRSGGEYLSYLRGKGQGEARLRGNRSIGIGGHISSGDKPTLFGDDHLLVAAHREVDEEVEVLERYTLKLSGLINDDSNEVGKVHLGLVYIADLKKPEIGKREKAVADLRYEPADKLREERDRYETWSQLIIDGLHML